MTWITTHTKMVKGRDGAADAVTHWPAVRAGGGVCSRKEETSLEDTVVHGCQCVLCILLETLSRGDGAKVPAVRVPVQCTATRFGGPLHFFCSFGRPCSAGPTASIPPFHMWEGGDTVGSAVESSPWGTLHKQQTTMNTILICKLNENWN